MNSSFSVATAVVILPGVRQGDLRSPAIRRWLGQADIEWSAKLLAPLPRLLNTLSMPLPEECSAAYRLWGETGNRPQGWVAAADPVFLEARLDHLCLHRLPLRELPASELDEMFAELQAGLGEKDGLVFRRGGFGGYLQGGQAMPTSALSADSLDGLEPSPFMPVGEGAEGYHRLHSEIQMLLHNSNVQSRRAEEGRWPINALWIWGGGHAPAVRSEGLPPLFSDDPLLRGYWMSASGVIGSFNESPGACCSQAGGSFVASVAQESPSDPEDHDALCHYLDELRRLLQDGTLREVRLLLRDGLTVTLRRHHRFRFWRRDPAMLTAAERS